jgi:hypothetical protein
MLKATLLLLRLQATAVMDRRALVLENLALRRQVALQCPTESSRFG